MRKNRNIYGFLLVMLMALVSFSGCQNQPALPEGSVPKSQEELDQIKVQEAETVNLLKLQDQLNAIVLTKDIKKCEEIKNEVYFKSCNSHILANQAVEAKDREVCQKGISDEIKRNCLGYYEQLTSPSTPVIEEKKKITEPTEVIPETVKSEINVVTTGAEPVGEAVESPVEIK